MLLDVEEVETELEDLDLVDLQSGGLGDLLEVDVGELVALVSHFVLLLLLKESKKGEKKPADVVSSEERVR